MKREESRSFYVFLGVFVCVCVCVCVCVFVFFVFGRGEKRVEKPGREQNSKKKKDPPWSEGCMRLFIALA